MSDPGDYLQRLTQFVGQTRTEAIPPEVLLRTRQILLDTLPVMAWGMREPQLSALAQQQLAGQSERGGAWVVGAGRTGAPLDAAMLNGIAGASAKQEKPEFEVIKSLIEKLDKLDRSEQPMQVIVEDKIVKVTKGDNTVTTAR